MDFIKLIKELKEEAWKDINSPDEDDLDGSDPIEQAYASGRLSMLHRIEEELEKN